MVAGLTDVSGETESTAKIQISVDSRKPLSTVGLQSFLLAQQEYPLVEETSGNGPQCNRTSGELNPHNVQICVWFTDEDEL